MIFRILLSAVLVVAFCCTGVNAQINRDAPMGSPTIDGVISAAEAGSQLVVPMVWPVATGWEIPGNAPSADDLSATWYVSWDANNLYIAADVKDNTQDWTGNDGGPFNVQDTAQPTFNPHNDPGCGFPACAAIYDLAIDNKDGTGAGIYRHGPSGWDASPVSVAGSKDGTAGYVLESAIPWSTAVGGGYTPANGDVHGLSFILVSQDDGNGTILYTDFGNGSNTIGNSASWNSITLVPEPGTLCLLVVGSLLLLARRRNG